MLDPRLKVLQLVAHHGTVTAAAAALHYSPSAVSYQLRQLAEELGVELVAQRGRGIQLTAAARALLRHVEALQAQAERAYAELASLSEEPSGSFTLCGFSTAATNLLPPAAAALRERHPGLRVRVIEAEPARCFDLLLAGEADLALVINSADTPSTADERFDQQPLLDDPLDLVVPARHRLTEFRAVTLADAADEPWIVALPGGAYHDLVRTACMAAGFTPNIAHYANEWDTGAALVAHGFGIILVPRLARLHDDWPVVRLPLHGEPAPARRITAATRLGRRDHPAVAASLETISTTAATLLPPSRLR
ncbi:DNA-binding transcriptional regulator, LysR family [Saccharopolyspora antimicrobica]|uniref:DNA-binding transcriptional LysR family regulator n=1 Tax=Saccharopolyspora antimicrobica TaxID=455193 RepID=A0A1I5H0C4_9PSEU|nr:LysR substrate-binding domain-containing protein [Saccharopolyspora antimicrobica]RKT90050.1 DNA-binding transcriptional LysR family regulator [Saccharopolyspora antimicrobica]SFO41570.1 DNA-binding transcriptional regulator, LysR family [Saccharopolyspora antimicrobica]